MHLQHRSNSRAKIWRRFISVFGMSAVVLLYSQGVFADDQSIGTVAATITGSFSNVAKLMVAASYIAGIGFAAAGILKFKQHKDNPTQVPLGGPIALIFIAAALIWLPAIIQSTGGTVFGGGAEDTHGSAEGKDVFGDE